MLDGESGMHFMASSLTVFDALWRNFTIYCEDILYCELPKKISELNTKFAQAAAIVDGDNLQIIYNNVEYRLRFVFREGAGRLNIF